MFNYHLSRLSMWTWKQGLFLSWALSRTNEQCQQVPYLERENNCVREHVGGVIREELSWFWVRRVKLRFVTESTSHVLSLPPPPKGFKSHLSSPDSSPSMCGRSPATRTQSEALWVSPKDVTLQTSVQVDSEAKRTLCSLCHYEANPRQNLILNGAGKRK